MAELDELEALERIARRDEEAAEQARRAELGEEDEPEAEAAAAPPPEAVDAGGKRAEVILGVLSAGLENLADPRMALPPEEVERGRENLGPALAKYGMTGGGDGDIPYGIEVRAGFYVGGLFKRIWRGFRALAQHDEQQKQQQEKEWSEHGQQSGHETTEQAYTVSGEFGVREVGDVAPPITDPE